MSVFLVSTVALLTRGPLLHQLSQLDRAAASAPIVKAALGVCHALEVGPVSHTLSLDVLSRRQCNRSLIDHDLFDDSLQDVLLDAMYDESRLLQCTGRAHTQVCFSAR